MCKKGGVRKYIKREKEGGVDNSHVNMSTSSSFVAQYILLPKVMNQSINTTNAGLIPKGEIAGIVLRALCFILGMIGNITVVVVLRRNLREQNFTMKLMLNLAASDIMCTAMLPVWMYNLAMGWTMDLHLCPFFIFLTHTAIHASVISVTLMSVQRYMVVLNRPQWSRLGRRGEYGMLTLVWILAGVLAISPATTYDVIEDGSREKCEQVFQSEKQKVGVLLLETIALSVLPFSILLVSYVCLHRKVTAKLLGSHQRLTVLLTSIVVTLFLLCLPYHIVNVMIIVAPLELVQSVLRVAYRGPRRAVQGIIYLHNCVNPVLYAFNYRNLRNEQPKTDINNQQMQSFSHNSDLVA